MGTLLTLEEATKAGAFTVLGGFVLKIIQVGARFLLRKRELGQKQDTIESDYESNLRAELRSDLARRDEEIQTFRKQQREQFEALQKEVHDQEEALDEWKGKYWDLFQKHSNLEAQMVALQNRAEMIERENANLRQRVEDLVK